jgi:actin-related protein 6
MAPRAKPPERKIADQTLVLDNGAYNIKAGFVTDNPDAEKDCHLIPNCLARTRDKRIWIGSQLENCKDFGEVAFRRPVEKGYLVNWESEQEIWNTVLGDKDSKIKVSMLHSRIDESPVNRESHYHSAILTRQT